MVGGTGDAWAPGRQHEMNEWNEVILVSFKNLILGNITSVLRTKTTRNTEAAKWPTSLADNFFFIGNPPISQSLLWVCMCSGPVRAKVQGWFQIPIYLNTFHRPLKLLNQLSHRRTICPEYYPVCTCVVLDIVTLFVLSVINSITLCNTVY